VLDITELNDVALTGIGHDECGHEWDIAIQEEHDLHDRQVARPHETNLRDHQEDDPIMEQWLFLSSSHLFI